VLDKKGKLYILAIGVDTYPKLGSLNSLHYSAEDAKLMLDTLTKTAGPLHTQVVSKLLVSGETRRRPRPTSKTRFFCSTRQSRKTP
jgi:uncharacterized caspase-like protein